MPCVHSAFEDVSKRIMFAADQNALATFGVAGLGAWGLSGAYGNTYRLGLGQARHSGRRAALQGGVDRHRQLSR